jgi:hypothetical protein
MSKSGNLPNILLSPIDTYKTSIGNLAIYPLTLGLHADLTKLIRGPLAPCDELEFVKHMILHTCYPETSLGDDRSRPKSPVLTRDEIGKLGNDEIETIAKVLIDGNDFLRKNRQADMTQDSKEHPSNKNEHRDAEHKPKEGETNCQYLHRLYCLYDTHMQSEMIPKLKVLLAKANFSDNLQNHITKTLHTGESLSKLVAGIQHRKYHHLMYPPSDRSGSLARAASVTNQPTEQTEIENIEKTSEISMEVFGDRMDQIVDLLSSFSTFSKETNEANIGIASEIKSSSKSASKLSGTNIFLTVLVIVATGIGLWNTDIDRKQSRVESQMLRQSTYDLNAELTILNHAVDMNGESIGEDLSALLAELKLMRASREDQIHTILTKHDEHVTHMAQCRIEDQQIYAELIRKLSDLEEHLLAKEVQIPPVVTDE